MSIPTTYDGPAPKIAVIGGTGISKLEGFTPIAHLTLTTPWGAPSSPIAILNTPSGAPVAFVARHGVHHEYNPSEVPARANLAALRSLGVRTIIAFSAVGSLREEIKPRDFVLPNQIIDRTKGIRPATFFENGLVGHVGFSDPFSAELSSIIQTAARSLEDLTLHSAKTVICMEGPQFSTRAESKMYRSWGGDIINMSVLPEAKLAREAELGYAMICMATDYDCFRDEVEGVNVPEVMAHMKANAVNAQRLVGEILGELVKEEHAHVVEAKSLVEGSKWSVTTAPVGRGKEALERIGYLFPGYFE